MSLSEGAYKLLLEPGEPTDGPVYSHLPLTGAALPVVLISIAYTAFVLKIGPKWMQNRVPFQLKNIMIAYNWLQILLNLFLFIGIGYLTAASDELQLSCFLKLRPDHRLKLLEVTISYVYFLVKIFDYMDTIFFVLRKSFKQITFLHVYHHIMMVFVCYLYIHYHGSSGHMGIVGFFNSFVHAVMYTYYLLSSLRPNAQQSLWWKKYITKLQITQFVLILIQQAWPLLVRRDCDYPRGWLYLSNFQAIMMLYLFGSFYKKTYLRKDTQSEEAKPNDLVEKVAAKTL